MKNNKIKQYWEKRLSDNFGLNGVGYQGLGNNYNRWMYKIRRKVFLRVVSTLSIDFNRTAVIDVGSGTGFYIDRWLELEVGSITGLDITLTAVTNLQKKYPNSDFLLADIGSEIADKQAGSYDVVTAFDVLFHIIDDGQFQRAIENIYTLMKPEGFFVFSDNFLRQKAQRSEHQVSRTLEDITKTLEAAGFSVLQRRPMFVLMNAPVDSQSQLLHFYWRQLTRLVRKSEWLGTLTGRILYPLELFLTAKLKESPSTEIMICRKGSC